MKHILSPTVVELVSTMIDQLYDRVSLRFLGPKSRLGGKVLRISYNPQLTLEGLFASAAETDGHKPNMQLFNSLARVAGTYLDASKEKTKARVIHNVQGFLSNASAIGVDTDAKTVLGGELAKIWGEVTSDVKRIVDTESSIARNFSIADGVIKANAALGVNDPTIMFICVHDDKLCGECKRLHLMPDGITPRTWKMSECGSGYHKKGDISPKISGLHPHERCVLTTLMPGFGFDASGRVRYIAPGHDEYATQRNTIEKSEAYSGELLEKGFKQKQIQSVMEKFGWTLKPASGREPHDNMVHPTIKAKIPFQRGYKGDYDTNWAKQHWKSAGLMLVHGTNKVVPDPEHEFHPHYVALGHVPEKQPGFTEQKTWSPPSASHFLPIASLELGGNYNPKEYAKATQNMKRGQTESLPHLNVMDMGDGTFGSLEDHHLLQAARDSGMTHVPVKITKKEAQ